MCNIAGYVGERDAAPILIEMIRAQEGQNGGFYTGIATLHEGRIHYRKLVGSLDDLLSKTDAASLPGKIGIIHSRTPGFSGDEWSHPFVCERDGEVINALVLNGSVGHFRYLDEKRIAVAEQLLAEGFTMRSRLPADYKDVSVLNKPAAFMQLGDGTRVHPTDVFCQLASKYMLEGESAPDALSHTMYEIPKEIVGLMLSLSEPDSIAWTRVNQPMHVAFAPHGAYLATAPHAIPEDAGEYSLLPLLCSGLIKKDGFSVRHFEKAVATVAPLSPRVRHEAYELICRTLREGKCKLSDLSKLVKPLFDSADCVQATPLVYPILCDLMRQGLLKVERRTRPGVFEGLSAPIDYMYIED